MKDFTLRRRDVLWGLSGFAATAALPGQMLAANQALKVASVFSVPVDQQWASRIHIALKSAEARGDITYSWSESIAYTDMERVLRDWSMKGTDLIVGEAYPFEEAVRKMAAQFPKTAYLMGSSGVPAAPAFSTFDDHIDDAAYLCGMMAGGLTKSNVIGMVSAIPIPTKNRLLNAFKAGALEVNPNAKFLVVYIGSWFDPPKAKEATFGMAERGADVFYAERDGVSDAAKELGLLSFGNLVSTQPQFPATVVSSALWHMEPTIDSVVRKLKEGSYKPENYGTYAKLKFGGSSMAPLGTFEDKVPDKLKKLVATRAAEIQKGTFEVKAVPSQPKSTL